MHSKTQVLAIICSLLIAGILGHKNYLASSQLLFVIEMKTSTSGVSQVYFDTGHGFNGQNSSRLQVQGRNFQKYSFPIPASIKSIRFDPIDKPAAISIKSAVIENVLGNKLKLFSLQSFKAKRQISRMAVNEGVLLINTTDNATDPIIKIQNSSFDRGTSWIYQRGWIYSGYAFLSFVILMGFSKHLQKLIEAFEWLRNCAVANPKKTIILVGFISSVISCYPVVFFGESFVHLYGVAALYGGPPWIPGLPLNTISENFRGSDVGATAWSIAPNSVVQHDSIFRDFEFPFWNRYVGGGIPLFAQGYSMIGDVLHWIPVALEGSAIGWDIKFVLSKAIFAVGMGLLVNRLTGTLLAGILISISSCFIGFFAWRFDHPAFFVLTYTPWIVLQWHRLGRALALPNPNIRNSVLQGLLLAIVTWLQLNAGVPKEGVITACFLQALGMLVFWVQISPIWGRIRSAIFAFSIAFALIMISAPYWLLFLDALSKSFTNYDIPIVFTFHPWMIIGFFENYFFQKSGENSVMGPSTNLFILFFMSSAMLSLCYKQSIMVYGSWGLFILALVIAYGFVPTSILLAIPFINKIQHVGNTFSVPMIILALIIAGYGIRDYLVASKKIKGKILSLSLLSFLGLWFIMALAENNWESIGFVMVVCVIALIGFLQLYQKTESDVWKNKRALIILICCFFMLHLRHGMHLMTGDLAIDDFVINPTVRPDFSNKSDAIEYVKHEIDKKMVPTRVIGEEIVLFPGYNSRLGLEGIIPVEAVRNKHYEKLLSIIDYPEQDGWNWLRLIKSDQIASRSASLDLLGIGYIVAALGTKMPQGMKLVHSSDLDVWQRESAWPRAFFVNKILEAHKPSDILEALADKSHTPFAAVETQFIPKKALNNSMSYQVIPAREYKLTNNSTHFSVEASGSGIIVLGENYYPGDFVANLNGEEVDYFRVNEASKGIWVNKAGKYDVDFTYRPEKLSQALWICFFGLVFLYLLIGASGRFSPRLKMGDHVSNIKKLME